MIGLIYVLIINFDLCNLLKNILRMLTMLAQVIKMYYFCESLHKFLKFSTWIWSPYKMSKCNRPSKLNIRSTSFYSILSYCIIVIQFLQCVVDIFMFSLLTSTSDAYFHFHINFCMGLIFFPLAPSIVSSHSFHRIMTCLLHH